ncbi:MAG: sensor histidine kinase [Rhodocyclaceae bacterium]|nr:sensor histidine kinase [Rhodocyclaceae bacterium]
MNQSLVRRLQRAALFPLLLAVLGGTIGYWVAAGVVRTAYDESLRNDAEALVDRVRLNEGRLVIDFPDQAEALLRTDQVDTLYFRVRSDHGELIAGDAELPPPEAFPVGAGPVYFQMRWGETDIRGVRLHRQRGGQGFYVTVAETLGKRQRAVELLLLGFGVAMAAIVAAAIAIVRHAIPTGLAPLAALQKALAERDASHLRPIDPARVPPEIRGVVEALNALLVRLDDSVGAQRRFLQNAAHQLRTPLASVQVQLDVLDAQPGPEALDRVRRATGRLTRLTNQLLVLARAESDAGLLDDAGEVALAPLIDDLVEEWISRADAAQLDLGIQRDPCRVAGEPTLLRELIANLMDNALKYTPAGGCISLRCVYADGGVKIEVEDDGPGIPPALRERAFARFTRLPGSRGNGSGLGLALVLQIVACHRGRITLDTPASGRGLCVAVWLPDTP